MKIRTSTLIILTLILASFQLGMGRRSDNYDEEARAAEKSSGGRRLKVSNPATGIASGIKSAAVDSTTGFVSETAEGTRSDAPVVGTLEGARKGTQEVLDHAVKGAVKVATLGQADVSSYEVREPEKNTDDTTKITIKIPGT